MYTKLPEQDFDENTESLPPYDDSRLRLNSLKRKTFCSMRSFFSIERLIIFVLLGVLIPCITLAISSTNCVPQTKFPLRNYGSNTDYMTLDHQKNALWLNLTLNDTEGSAGLVWSSDGNLDGQETVGMISMFHQLNCLAGLRMALQDSSEGKFIGIDESDNAHWPHCMDYLRQVRSIVRIVSCFMFHQTNETSFQDSSM
jgi:hypothetical protein